jgi:hypothetical protein
MPGGIISGGGKMTGGLLRRQGKNKLTKGQCKDTGMAMVLILLLVYLVSKRELFIFCAIGLHVLNMVAPQVYRPVAVIWFGISQLLGTITSKVVLSIAFFFVVVPVGVLRRILGKDSLRLRAFKAGTESVMQIRDRTFTGEDIKKPY